MRIRDPYPAVSRCGGLVTMASSDLDEVGSTTWHPNEVDDLVRDRQRSGRLRPQQAQQPNEAAKIRMIAEIGAGVMSTLHGRTAVVAEKVVNMAQQVALIFLPNDFGHAQPEHSAGGSGFRNVTARGMHASDQYDSMALN